jgi:multidrug efflux pump subunit AcrA (membrane-fusion protein)
MAVQVFLLITASFLYRERSLYSQLASGHNVMMFSDSPATSSIRYAIAVPALAVAILCVHPAAAQSVRPAADAPRDYVELQAPEVALINDVMVPAQVEGMLTNIAVEEGMTVEKGQILVVIDDKQAQLTLQLKRAEEKEARLNSENEVNLQDARNSLKLESEKAKAFSKIAEDGAMPFWEAETQRLEAIRQSLRLELAVLNKEIAVNQYDAKQYERQLAELEVSKRNIVAPFAGFVENRKAQLGEWVQAGSPILQLVQMDKLRAQGFFGSSDPNQQIRVGDPAVIEFKFGNQPPRNINGKVGFVGNDLDLSQRRRVWIEFDNERISENDWAFKPGMKPTIRIYPASRAVQ